VTSFPTIAPTGLRVKLDAVAAVIAGRMTIVEAAARFRAAGCPAPNADGESAGRSVIGWVHLALCDRPERAEEVSARLEQELQAYLTRRGGLLPTP
jgi:hypothetical protein